MPTQNIAVIAGSGPSGISAKQCLVNRAVPPIRAQISWLRPSAGLMIGTLRERERRRHENHYRREWKHRDDVLCAREKGSEGGHRGLLATRSRANSVDSSADQMRKGPLRDKPHGC